MPGLDGIVSMAAPFPAAYFIGHIVIGAMYLGQCPIQPFIPIYLLGMGFSLLLLMLLAYIYYHLRTHSEPSRLDRLAALAPFDTTLTASIWIVEAIFVLFWSIMGNVWLFQVYEPNYTNFTSDQYCAKTVYLWALWNTVGFDLLLGLLLLSGCCFFAGMKILECMNSDYERL